MFKRHSRSLGHGGGLKYKFLDNFRAELWEKKQKIIGFGLYFMVFKEKLQFFTNFSLKMKISNIDLPIFEKKLCAILGLIYYF